MGANTMDQLDIKILRMLQKDSNMSVAAIARKVGLSTSPCWKRIERLRSNKIIKSERAILDYQKLGFNLVAFVCIQSGDHSKEWLENFSQKVTNMPEVAEFHRMAGDVDYMLKVIVQDIQRFDEFYKRLIEVGKLKDVSSRFSMETIKSSTIIPI